jgi:hypothetical protein
LLTRLSITDSGVRGAGLKPLAGAPKLKHLVLAMGQASAAEVKQLTDALPMCKVDRIQVSP